jgi:hypothetical protein
MLSVSNPDGYRLSPAQQKAYDVSLQAIEQPLLFHLMLHRHSPLLNSYWEVAKQIAHCHPRAMLLELDVVSSRGGELSSYHLRVMEGYRVVRAMLMMVRGHGQEGDSGE